jgi:hypothetical protein
MKINGFLVQGARLVSPINLSRADFVYAFILL